MPRVCLLLLLAASLAACGARQVKTERKGRIITLTDKILDTGGTDTVRFGRLGSGEIAVLRQRDERTGRHRQIRPQLRMHDARI